jgi:hypothetical protein
MPAASPIIHICAPHKGIVTLPQAARFADPDRCLWQRLVIVSP